MSLNELYGFSSTSLKGRKKKTLINAAQHLTVVFTHRDFSVIRVTRLQLPAERQHGVRVVFSRIQQLVVLDLIFMDFSVAVCKVVLENK